MGEKPKIKASVRGYWWAVLMRALKEAFAKIGIESVPGAVGTAVAYSATVAIAAYLFGLRVVQGYYQDGVVAVIVAALSFPLFVVWKLVSIPATRDAEQRQIIQDQGDKLEAIAQDPATKRLEALEAKYAALPPPPPPARQITDVQLAAMKAAVGAMSQPGRNGSWRPVIYLIHDFNDESGLFAKRLGRAMEEAGLRIERGLATSAEEGEHGVIIRLGDPAAPLSPATEALTDFLNRSGIAYEIKKIPDGTGPDTQLFVAQQKPAP